MRVAIGNFQERVSPRLELTKDFYVFTVLNNNIVSKERFSPKDVPFTLLPDFLSDLEVDLVLCGSLPLQLLYLFKRRGIEVIWGAIGDIDEAISSLLKGGFPFPPPSKRRWRWGKNKKWR